MLSRAPVVNRGNNNPLEEDFNSNTALECGATESPIKTPCPIKAKLKKEIKRMDATFIELRY
jgi:hypothetical protein